MAIKFLFSKQDVYDWIQPTKKNISFPSNFWSIIDLAENYLKEMGIRTAEVDIIKDADGNICHGSARLPLLIKTGKEDSFVLKSYDCHNPQTEKEILQVVGGTIAPKIKYFSREFYTEVLINHKKAKTLQSIADNKNLINAVKIGAKMHARLANMGINYGHCHWLDEFHIDDDKLMITDFGTSYFFEEEKDSDYMLEKSDYIRLNGIESFFRKYKPIRCFTPEHPKYSKIKSKLLSLTSELSEMISLLHVIDYALVGIRYYIEFKPRSIMNGLPGSNNYDFMEKHWYGANFWDTTMIFLSDFVESFTSEYKELSANRTKNT